jgi:hypothetical protein
MALNHSSGIKPILTLAPSLILSGGKFLKSRSGASCGKRLGSATAAGAAADALLLFALVVTALVKLNLK